MKNPLLKRMARQMLRSPGKVLPIFLAMLFIIVFASSFFTSQDSVRVLYDRQLAEGKIEDGQFTTITPLSDELKKKVEELGVRIYPSFNLELTHEADKKLRAFENRKDINVQQILSGRLAKDSGEVALSGNYARANHIQVNDRIQLEGKEFLVTGLISLPDYSSLLKNRDDLVMDTGHFGTCLLDDKGFASFEDLPICYTYVYHHNDRLDTKEGREKLKELVTRINKENLTIDGVIQQDNHCITYIMDDMGGDVPTMTTFMAILFVALAFISAVQAKSLIENEAPVIGTLLALGYRKKEILQAYLLTPLVLTLAAGILGNVLAYSYVYKMYVQLYYNSFDLPNFQPLITSRSFFLTCMIPLFIYMTVNYWIVARSLRFKPLDFLRGRLRKETKKSKINLSHFAFLRKFKIRVLLDNKLNVAALLFGVFLANMLLVYGLSVKPIFSEYAQNIQDTMKYNYTYFVKAEEKGLEAEKATILQVELPDSDDKKVQLYGLDRGSEFQIENWDELKENEIAVSEGFLQRFSCKAGDSIKIREPYNSREISLQIKEVVAGNTLFQLFSKREYVNKMVDQKPDYMNAYLSNNSLKLYKDRLISVIDRDKMTKFMEHFLDGFGFVFDVLFYIGIAFSLIVTSIVTSLIVDKSRVNMAYLKIFGFHDRELTKLYVRHLLLMLLVFQLLVIPVLDKMMQWIMLLSMAKLDAYIIADIPLSNYLKAIGCSMFIFTGIQILARIRISRLDMVKELKVING